MQPRALWVNRDIALTDVALDFLENLGFEVEAVGDLEECVEQLETYQPDILIVDEDLESEGGSLLDCLGEQVGFYEIPLVISLQNAGTHDSTRWISRIGSDEDVPYLALLAVVAHIIAAEGIDPHRTPPVRSGRTNVVHQSQPGLRRHSSHADHDLRHANPRTRLVGSVTPPQNGDAMFNELECINVLEDPQLPRRTIRAPLPMVREIQQMLRSMSLQLEVGSADEVRLSSDLFSEFSEWAEEFHSQDNVNMLLN